MIKFVNAKINIGLQIVSRRNDGYHDLQTVFYPVGCMAGTAENPVEFCDILEAVNVNSYEESGKFSPFTFSESGRHIDCPPYKNLVYRAICQLWNYGLPEGFSPYINIEKHLPDGAGMGGGSADAAFTLKILTELAAGYARQKGITWLPPDESTLYQLALKLGADCPFFIYNRPAYATGIGEKLSPINLDLSGLWLLVIKPEISISTRQAFAGVVPRSPDFDLRKIPEIPINCWRDVVINDFEKSLFPQFPILAEIKNYLYDLEALYASLTGSGSCIYGIYNDLKAAQKAKDEMEHVPTIGSVYLLKL